MLKNSYHFPKKSFASTGDFTFHCIPTLTGSLPGALCLLLVEEPAGDGVGVGLLVVDPIGEGVGVCLVDGGGVICRDAGGVLTGVFGVEFFLCLYETILKCIIMNC